MVTSQCVPGPRPLTDHQTPTLRIAPPTGRTPTCTTRYQLLTKSITNLAVVSPKQYFFFCRLNGLKKIKTTDWTVVLITRSQADPYPKKKTPQYFKSSCDKTSLMISIFLLYLQGCYDEIVHYIQGHALMIGGIAIAAIVVMVTISFIIL